MNSTLSTIPLTHLALAFIPALAVVAILLRWSLNTRNALWAMGRMLAQLLLVGYVLAFIFEAEQAAIVMGVLAVMLIAAGWISLGPLAAQRTRLLPRMVIPLAGMIFANAMNAVSLAAERFAAESSRGADYLDARRTSLRAALIPQINALFAVGVVSFPGMMTGQILSGVDPLVAVRYQVMVMCMVFGAAGISAAIYLSLVRGASQPGSKAKGDD